MTRPTPTREEIAAVVRDRARRGSYQMSGESLPYETFAGEVADAVLALFAHPEPTPTATPDQRDELADDFTPTTDQVRLVFGRGWLCTCWADRRRNGIHDDDKGHPEFDRWLTRIRQEAKAEALREAAAVPAWSNEFIPEHIAFGQWLRARADRIANGDDREDA